MYNEYQKTATNNYRRKNKKIEIIVPEEEYDVIKLTAESRQMRIAEFVKMCIKKETSHNDQSFFEHETFWFW